MGIITKEVEIRGDKRNKKVRALFDSGSAVCQVRRDIIKDVATIIKLLNGQRFKMANNEIINTNLATIFEIEIKGYFPAITPYVIDGLGCDLIVGANFMQQWKIKLDLEKEDLMRNGLKQFQQSDVSEVKRCF